MNLIKQEKKLETNEDQASKDLLKLYKEIAALQSHLSLIAGRLLQIRKIKSKVKEKHSKATYRNLQEVEQQDNLLSILDTHKGTMLKDLQVNHIPNNVN